MTKIRNYVARIWQLIIHKQLRDYPGFRRIDFVDFDSVGLFMYQDDNLYQHAVPQHRKKYDLREFSKNFADGTIAARCPSGEEIAGTSNPAHVIEIMLSHCWGQKQNISFLDVGANTGLIGLRAARYAQNCGEHIDVRLFEPGSSVDLVQQNIGVNGLTDSVTLSVAAISDYSGKAIMHLSPGHSDSDRLLADAEVSVDSIVPVIDIRETVAEIDGASVLFLKLDTEGLEPLLIEQTTAERQRLPTVLMFEFMPWRYPSGEALELLKTLCSNHAVFDLGYLPNPWHVRPVQGDQLSEFEEEIRAREFGYTDILAVPRTLPGMETLEHRLSMLGAKTNKSLFLID